MWKPEDFVPSIKVCKKLKELGFPQEGSGWFWDIGISGRLYLCFLKGRGPTKHYFIWDGKQRADVFDDLDMFYEDFVRAPTSGELALYLPENFEEEYHEGKFWVWDDCGNGEYVGVGKTEAEARADLLITLAEIYKKSFKFKKRR